MVYHFQFLKMCKIFCANLFVTILRCFKKHNFHNKNMVLLEHLEFFAYMY